MEKKVRKGDTTKRKSARTTSNSVVEKSEVVTPKVTKVSKDSFLVCDPGASNDDDDSFVDNILDTDEYDDG